MKKILGIVLAFVMLVTVLAIIPAAQEAVQKDGYYVYLDEGITLVKVEGGEEYKVSVAAKDLGTFPKFKDGSTSEYSVESYINALINDQPKYMKELMTALLNYGAAAQQYFGAAGTLVGEPVTGTEALEEATAPDIVVTNDEGIYMGASLLLTGTIQLRFYFKGDDVTASVTTGVGDEAKTKTYNAFNPEGKAYSYIDVPVMPYAMSDSVTVTVGDTTSVTYAPINYLKNKAADPETTDELRTMVASMYAYGAAAKAYADHEHIYEGAPIIIDATCGKDGSKTKTCSCGYVDVEILPATGEHTFDSNATDDDWIITKVNNEYHKTGYCGTCKLMQSQGIYTDYDNNVTNANTLLSAASSAVNGTKTDIGGTYTSGTPGAYPTAEHPRLLLNNDTVNSIKEQIAAGDMELIKILADIADNANFWYSEYKVQEPELDENDEPKKNDKGEIIYKTVTKSKYVSSRNSANLGTSSKPTYQVFSPSGSHNYNPQILNSIMAKAFLYLYTGVDLYAKEATANILEYVNTLYLDEGVGDYERYWGEAMFAAAIVYDWCYHGMTETDRTNIVKAVRTMVSGDYGWSLKDGTKYHMEIGFPPSDQGAVNGHGCERQLLRDYLSFAIAIYDEDPSWYAYIGGRFYQEYLPVREEFYKSGMYPQGISTYVQIRFSSDLWSAWLLTTATGSNPYEGMGQDRVIRSLFSRVVDGAYYVFDEGDDERDVDNWGREIIRGLSLSATISSYLYDDSTAAAWSNYVDYSYTSSLYLLILRSTGVKDDSDARYDGLELICYNGGFLNEIIAHTDWSGNAASVLMKIGGYTTGNHDHGDAGSFQIYYKGMLAGDTGYYDDYSTTSSSHFQKYHQATVAHNSILVYGTSNNRTTSYGQKVGSDYGEPTTRSAWLNGTTYKTAELLGVCTEYDRNGNPKYAYIAGDITPAYTNSSITGVERRMLSVFNTQNSDAPMYFFVYDRVKTSNSTYQAAFLLHTVNEPTIDGNTVTVTSGGNVYNKKPKTGGQLVLQSIIGGNTIRTYGGENMNYVVNGSQVATEGGENDGYWGRVEILTDKGTDHTMLNVMYVTDAGKTLSLPATGFSTDKVDGAAIGNSVAVFLKNTTSNSEALTFTAPDTGYGEKVFYYVSGMAEGRWTVTCGSQVINVSVGKDDGLLVFNTYAGKEVTITPATGSSGSFDNELPIEPIN